MVYFRVARKEMLCGCPRQIGQEMFPTVSITISSAKVFTARWCLSEGSKKKKKSLSYAKIGLLMVSFKIPDENPRPSTLESNPGGRYNYVFSLEHRHLRALLVTQFDDMSCKQLWISRGTSKRPKYLPIHTVWERLN